MSLEFRVLGPVEIWTLGRHLAIRGTLQRGLLSVLLLQANRVVPTERLIGLLWGAAPPKAARGGLQGQIWRLRRTLAAAGAAADDRLVQRPPGYLLRVGAGELDLAEFQRLADQGREALSAGRAEPAAAALRAALELWRGRPFEDADMPALDEQRARFEQRHLATLEDRLEADLALGRYRELLSELEALVAAHPLRERLWGQLMLALYRSGRQAEALDSYRRLRERLVRDHGIEPSPSLQRLHRRILALDPSLEPRAAPAAEVRASARPVVTPRQLPLDVATFTGREAEVAELERTLAAAQPGSRTVVVGVIHGLAGIGKSALAIHVAHRLAARFPDGQLYVNLQGATSALVPLAPLEVLGRFLRALGMDGNQVPEQVDEAAALYRSQVAGRRLLVVLDNALDAAQIAPLLPSHSGSAVLVTCRGLLGGPDGAHQLHLDVLSAEEAVALLGRLAGARRIAAEPEAAAEVARRCGYLPLALRIAGSRLAARRGWPVGALAGRLADARRRLDELERAEMGVRASFAVSHHQLEISPDRLDRAAAAAFGLLGLLDGPDIGTPVAARLLALPEERAGRVLERLADAELVETPSPGRYRMHDLLRLYAREVGLERHDELERTATLGRAFGVYVATAWRTLELLRPGDPRLTLADQRWRGDALELPDATAALAWLETERSNLLAATEQAARSTGPVGAATAQLAHALFGFFLTRNHWRDLTRVNRLAIAVTRRSGDRAAHALATNDLGIAHEVLGHYEEALACHQDSLAISRELGDRHGQAISLGNLGLVHERLGRLPDALACQRASLDALRELGERRGQAVSLGNLGLVHERLGRLPDALACQRESLAIFRRLGDRRAQGVALTSLGLVHERLGQSREALACLEESLAIHRELGDRDGQAEAMTALGVFHGRRGRCEEALAYLWESLAIHRELGYRHGEAETLRELGTMLMRAGRQGQARARWREALAIFEQLRTTDADGIRALLAGDGGAPDAGP